MRAAESRAGSAIGACRSTDTETVWTFDMSSIPSSSAGRKAKNPSRRFNISSTVSAPSWCGTRSITNTSPGRDTPWASSTRAGTGDRGRENCDMGETTYKRKRTTSRKTVGGLSGLTFRRDGGRVVAGDPVVHAGREGAAGGLLRAGDGVLHGAGPGRGAVGPTAEFHAHATGLGGPRRSQVEEERCDGSDEGDGVERGALHAPRNCSCSVLPSIASVADLPFVATWVTSSK